MGRIKTLIFVVVGLLLVVFIIPNILHNETSPMCFFVGIVGVLVALMPIAANIVKKKSRRCYKIFAMIGYCALILGFIVMAVLTIIMVSGAHDNTKNIPADANVIVPGCLLQGDKPGQMLQNRLDAANSYLSAHPNSICVVCGGYIGKYTQAEVMKKYLITKGIAASRILVDGKSDTTYQNISDAKALLGGKQDVVIATDVFS